MSNEFIKNAEIRLREIVVEEYTLQAQLVQLQFERSSIVNNINQSRLVSGIDEFFTVPKEATIQ